MVADAQSADESNQEEIERGKQLIKELAKILRMLPDQDIGKLLGIGEIEDLLVAILDPSTVENYPTYAEFFFKNKRRSVIFAHMSYIINQRFCFRGKKDGNVRYISPDIHQWFDDGIMLLIGKEPFTRFITLYRNKELRVAIASRDIEKGEDIRPEDLKFIKINELKEYVKTIPPKQINDLERPIRELMKLIDRNESDESRYQRLLEEYPWVFGAEYSAIQRHEYLDDENIPDFTGIKVSDSSRDIFELKPPTMKIFTKSGDFALDFYNAWNQAERYLDFTHRNDDYLRKEKGRIFDNPKCYLILGWNLSKVELEKIRIKERGNPSIRLLTYNDLIAFMESTVTLIKGLISNTQTP